MFLILNFYDVLQLFVYKFLLVFCLLSYLLVLQQIPFFQEILSFLAQSDKPRDVDLMDSTELQIVFLTQ